MKRSRVYYDAPVLAMVAGSSAVIAGSALIVIADWRIWLGLTLSVLGSKLLTRINAAPEIEELQ